MNETKFLQYLEGLSTSATGQRRAVRIANCTFQTIREGEVASFSCKDATCPRCRKSRSYRLAEKIRSEIGAESEVACGSQGLDSQYRKSFAFCTFTFRESASVSEFQKQVTTRRNFIVGCIRRSECNRCFLVAEFTLNEERIHLHYHSLIEGTPNQLKAMKYWFDAAGERNVQIDHYDGRVQELVKYFMPSYGYPEGVVLSGCKHLRIRMMYGFGKKKTVEEF